MTSPANPNLAPGAEVEGQDVAVPADGAEISAYVSQPKGGGATAGVIVIHENRGLMPYLRDVADGLASNGYLAIAPDLLSRDGGTASIEDIPAALQGIPRERHVGDVQSVAKWLQSQPGISSFGIIGFCFGGAIVWRFATENPDLAAAVPFYGANPPLDAVPNIKAAVYAIYGETDERINAGIPDVTQALNAAGTTHDMKVYAGAGHAFHNHTNPPDRYNATAAKEAWGDALAWFKQHLG